MSKIHPYINSPEFSFWDRSISEKAVGEIDPSRGMESFEISVNDAVMTMGSCFAQHVSQRLSKVGLNYLVSESHPNGEEFNAEGGYGVFTARYGNIYTIAQSLQLLKRCLGESIEGDIWRYKDSYIDSFRPRAVPGGFSSEDALLLDRQIHLNSTLTAFKTAKILVFTLGLTEGWKNNETNQIYAIAPGVGGGDYNSKIHHPFNMSAHECISGLNELLDLLRTINPTVKVILTVSPVPLAATHTSKHVLTATFSSKAKLRVAAEEVAEANENVDYFPSFEIIQGLAQSGKYFKHDLREVESRGVDHVMRVFFDYYYKQTDTRVNLLEDQRSVQELTNANIICDEDIFKGINK